MDRSEHVCVQLYPIIQTRDSEGPLYSETSLLPLLRQCSSVRGLFCHVVRRRILEDHHNVVTNIANILIMEQFSLLQL